MNRILCYNIVYTLENTGYRQSGMLTIQIDITLHFGRIMEISYLFGLYETAATTIQLANDAFETDF